MLPKKIYCTSTPRRRTSRLPKLVGLELDTNQSMPDISAVGQLYTPSLAKKIFERTKRISQKLYGSAEKRFSSDSTPESGKPRQSLRRKSLRRNHKSPPASEMTRYNRKRREHRNRAFNQGRRISKLALNTDQTYSIVGSEATTSDSVSESVMEEAEIMKFHAVVNNCNGIIDFDENHNSPPSDGNDFLQLCHRKRSEYSDDCVVLTNDTQLNSVSKTTDEHTQSTLTAYSVGSMDSEMRGTRQSSHCARVNWNQHKIPQLVSYKVEKPELGKSQLSVNSSRNNRSALMASFNARIAHSIDVWTKLPIYLQYYVVCATIALLAMIYMQIS